MCPACMATAAVIAAKATTAGGFTAFVVKKLRPKAETKPKSVSTHDSFPRTDGEAHEPTRNRLAR